MEAKYECQHTQRSKQCMQYIETAKSLYGQYMQEGNDKGKFHVDIESFTDLKTRKSYLVVILLF